MSAPEWTFRTGNIIIVGDIRGNLCDKIDRNKLNNTLNSRRSYQDSHLRNFYKTIYLKPKEVYFYVGTKS